MELNIDWTIGYDDENIGFIDRNTLIYISGQYVCFISDDGGRQYLPLPGYTATRLIVHPSENVFALAETEKRNPSIYLYNYPALEIFGIIKDFATLDICKICFSNSDFLVAISGLPDFDMTLWNFKNQNLLCSTKLDYQNIGSLSISPVNWKNIIVTSGHRIYIYTVEHCGSLYLTKDKYIKLPPKHIMSGSDFNATLLDSRVTVVKTASRAIAYDFELPPSAKAGVSTKYFKEFLESLDDEIRCTSVSHAWSGTGDLYFGCEEGQLIKLDMENMVFKVIFNPMKDMSDSLRLRTPSSNSEIDQIELSGNINKMCFAKEGIYFGGEDGILRIAKQIDNEISDNIENVHEINGPISNLLFNYNYTKLAVISYTGIIDVLSVNENIELPTSIANIGYGSFVGLSIIPGGKHIATLRKNGQLQIWNIEDRSFVSSFHVYQSASSLDSSPLWNVLAVGLDNGILVIIDINDLSNPRKIHQIKLHNSSIYKIQFSKRGQLIVTGGMDGIAVVLSGLVSDCFRVLGLTSFEGTLLDLRVFQNPTSDETAQIAISSKTTPDTDGANKLTYFELSPTVINDPSSFYENINGTFDEEAIRKMSLTFELPAYGCVLGVQPPEEKSPVVYAVEVDSRRLCKYQIPASPPRKEEETNKEAMLKIIQSNRINIPGISKSSIDSVAQLFPENFLSVDPDSDAVSTRASMNLDVARRDSTRSHRKNSLSRLSVVDNIDWKAMTKIKAKLNQYDSLPEKFQQQLKLIAQLEELNKAGNKASRLKPITVYESMVHEDPNVSIQSSINNRMIMTYGAEGVIRVIDLKNERYLAKVHGHQIRHNGVIEAIFSLDSNNIFSCSNDGILAFHKIVSTNAVKMSNEEDYGNLVLRYDSKIIQQNSELQSLASMAVAEMSVKKDSSSSVMKRVSTGLSVKSENEDLKTWSEKRVIEHQEEEDQQYQDLKSSIKEGIRSIRATIQKMLDENDKLSDLEKVDRQEFELDVEMKKKIHGDIDNEIKKVIEEIEYRNLAKQYILDVIKKECWDQMSVKGRSLCAFLSNIEVSNFPLKDRPQSFIDQIDMVVKRRMIEIEDLNDRKNYSEYLQKSTVKKTRDVAVESSVTTATSEENEENEDEEIKDTSNLTSHDLKDYDKFEKIAPNIKYLYPQLDLETRDQKIYQIILLKDIIYQMKIQFNKEFTEVYQKKEQEINRIKEKNTRINKILNDIDMAHLIQPDPELSSSEKPEKLLVVEDHEIKVERYLTDEQKRKLEEDRLAEEERKRREKLDNWRERGLEDMMGGVLEVKREDELKKDIPKPQFLIAGKAPEDWTDEEKKIFEEYEKKVKELNEEREKYKKQLEAEYKKLSGIIDDAKGAFDEILLNLFKRQILIQMTINQEEVKILRLQWSLLIDEELNARRKELLELKHENQLDIQALKVIKDNAKVLLDQSHEAYDTLVAEEKVMDKGFKREFLDVHGSIFEYITKLYKRRPRNRLLGTQIIPSTQMPNYSKYNPYCGRPASSKQKQFQLETLKNAIQDLDKQDANDTLETSLYERLCKSRKKRIMKEFEIKQMAFEIADMQAFYQKRLEEEKALENNDLHLDSLLETLENYCYQYHVNKEIQLIVKQGQVEVEAVPGCIHDFTDSIFIHRSTIEDLNKEIKELGRNKVRHMTKAKDSKKKFVHLEWELRRMLMEYEDLVRKMREIQCFKITKEIQRYLVTNDYDALINAEIQKMEQTINHLKMHQSKKLDSKKNRLRYINDSKLIKIQNENREIGVQLTELNVQVNERKHINAGFPSDSVGRKNVEMRYQKILQRQHLIDLAKSQAREVAVLRSEVERLRMRTFPALIQHHL